MGLEFWVTGFGVLVLEPGTGFWLWGSSHRVLTGLGLPNYVQVSCLGELIMGTGFLT